MTQFIARTTGRDFVQGLQSRFEPATRWGCGRDRHDALINGLARTVDEFVARDGLEVFVGHIGTVERLGNQTPAYAYFDAFRRSVNQTPEWTPNSSMPTSRECFQAYRNAGFRLLPLEQTPSLYLFFSEYSSTEEARFHALWAWAQRSEPFPCAWDEHPVDTLGEYLRGYFGVDEETTRVMTNKHLIALVGSERQRWLEQQSPVAEDRVAALQAELNAAIAAHEADIRLIERTFWEQAHERSWCSEAEQVIRGLNRGLTISMSEDRTDFLPEEEWEVLYYVDVIIGANGEDWRCLDHDARINVMAKTAEEARDKADDEASDDTFEQIIRDKVPFTVRSVWVSEWEFQSVERV